MNRLVALGAAIGMLAFAALARAGSEPLFAFAPHPPPPPGAPEFPPDGYLNGPCGLAVDSAGRFYVADHYHGAVEVFAPPHKYVARRATLAGPCELALDPSGNLYSAEFHRAVQRFGPQPSFSAGPVFATGSHPTGVGVDPATGRIYVDQRTQIAAYDSSGAPVEEGGDPVRIGVGSLQDGYGLAVSAYSGTEGFLYVPDAATATVKVYDPATDAANPVATITGPPGGFNSLRNSAVAVDRVTGEVYVVDDLQEDVAEQPLARVDVFDASGAYEGHLAYEVVDGEPTGLAVDNSTTETQGRVYATSGNTLPGGVYAYPPGAATTGLLNPPLIPGPPLGGTDLEPTIPIGGFVSGGGGNEIECEGDACQVLPPEPIDPTLTTLLAGPGNPKARYSRARRARRPHGHHRSRHRLSAGASSVADATGVNADAPSAAPGDPAQAQAPSVSASPSVRASSLVSGFEAEVLGAGGEAATLAGSHPYRLTLATGLTQAGGEADLRKLRFDLPPGLLIDPAAAGTCSATQFATPRSSPFESSRSGESCPDRSQVGTVEFWSGLGSPRRFGLFNLEPANGTALQLAASPYGVPFVFDGRIDEGDGRIHFSLESSEISEALRAEAVRVDLWGAPRDASHNGERGNCLDESESAYPWCKRSAGDPFTEKPVSLLSLPTECSPTLAFRAVFGSWQNSEDSAAEAVSRDPAGVSAPIVSCDSLRLEPHPGAFLTTKNASSPSGFVFRLSEEGPGLADPRGRLHSQARAVTVHLPAGVTLNPSMGAGLGVCTPSEYTADPRYGGCPSSSKIGSFNTRTPFYKGLLKGSIYLAKPEENPSGALIAIYLVGSAADRGIVVRLAGELDPDRGDGTLTAHFDHLPQFPYSELEVAFRSGQRAPLVSPDFCGPATTRIELSPWAQGATPVSVDVDSPIEAGDEGPSCPTGAVPPFSPGVVAGGVNANVGSYTPYFIHLHRSDPEQEITSYSLALPEGITGKLAGIPPCPDSSIAAARSNRGAVETANPSCPGASQVGQTETGYGVGSALTYAPGRIYLAGPYHGAPLSLVFISAATIGPFDLGTVVVRSAFDIDPRSARLSIDSSASDRIPHLLRGIPLHLRDVRIYLDHPNFTHNPSSCEPSQLTSVLTGAGANLEQPSDDSSASETERFQLLNCLTLGFRPKLGLRLRGSVRRGGFPALRATFVSRGERDSNLKRIEVDMPHQLFLAQNHIGKICTRGQFDSSQCPKGSAYGEAVAHTPLLDDPLRGDVYLRSSSNKLPDLVADLRSGSIRIVLEGRIGPTPAGGIQVFFDNLPDVPIERFSMVLDGGKRGLLTNSVDVCKRPPLAKVRALGQNNRGSSFTSTLRGRCGRKVRGRAGRRRPWQGSGP